MIEYQRSRNVKRQQNSSHRFTALLFLISLAVSACAQVPRDDGEEHGDAPFLIENGWRPLINGRNLAGWHGQPNQFPFGWVATRGVIWDEANAPESFSVLPAPGDRIVNPSARTEDLVTDEKFGDVELYVEFMVARKSNSGVYLNSHYEVQILDSFGVAKPTYHDCGGVYKRGREGFVGSAPKVNASRPPGQWQSFHIWFQAPRFDASGRKIANAKVLRVLHNGVLIQQNVEVDGPTVSALGGPEAAKNPLMLQGDHGPVAYRNIYIRPLERR